MSKKSSDLSPQKKLFSLLALSIAITAIAIITSASLFAANVISPFPDVSSDSSQFTAIKYLNNEGILKGNNDGSFNPKGTLNRAEWAAILSRLAGVEPDLADYNNCFPDVKEEWYAPYICLSKEQGWVKGYGAGELAGLYAPQRPVQDIEVLVTLARLTNWDVEDSETWYKPALNYAIAHNIYDESSPILNINRENTADVIFRMIATVSLGNNMYSTDLNDDVESRALRDILNRGAANQTMPDEITADNLDEAEAIIAGAVEKIQSDKYMFLGEQGTPQIKRSNVTFDQDGFDFNFEIGTTGQKISRVQVILYNSATGEWNYGYDSVYQTSEFERTGIDNFSDKYSLAIDQIRHGEITTDLADADPEQGYFTQVTTVDEKYYVIGAFGEVELYTEENTVSLASVIHADNLVAADILDGIGKIAGKLNPLSFFKDDSNDCKNANINVWDIIQKMLAERGIDLPLENTIVSQSVNGTDNTGDYKKTITSDQSMSIILPLGDDFSVVPNHEEVVRRFNELGRPQQGARYLMPISVHTWCVDGKCHCDVFTELINVETGVIEWTGTSEWQPCDKTEENIETAVKQIEDWIGGPLRPQDPIWTEPVEDDNDDDIDDTVRDSTDTTDTTTDTVISCQPSETLCAEQCVDLQTDDNNCSACGIVCLPGTSCSEGGCYSDDYYNYGTGIYD